MKILIADDEQIVLDSLRQILNKEENSEVEIAKTGREAIEKAEVFHPELVIMDIKMPGINGLEALTDIRRQDSQVILVILSAYENFTYAQEALRLDVFDYLLKPISKARILETVAKARQQLWQIKTVRQDELRLRERYKKLLPTITHEFLHNLINGIMDTPKLLEYQECLGITFDAGFFMAISAMDDYSAANLENETEYKYTFQQKMADLAEAISHLFPCLAGSVNTNPLPVFVPLPLSSEAVNNQEEYYSQKILSHFQSNASPAKIRIGIGNIYQNGRELRRSYQEALLALDNPSPHPLNFYRDLPKQADSNWETECFPDLYDGVKFGNVNKVETILQHISLKLIDSAATERAAIERAVTGRDRLLFFLLELLITAYRTARENSSGVNPIIPSYQKTIALFNENTDVNSIFTEVAKRIIYLTEIVKQGQETHVKLIIRQAKAIIDERYQEHLSLEKLAHLVNTSPFYLSRLFREELGMNFIDYVTKRCLDKAGILLGQGLSVKECCFAVGYNDPNYFSRIFRKHYGITPSEFREEQLSKQRR